jgi:hypothetical protein
MNMGKMDEWFSLPPEEISKRTVQFAKGYLAHKSEELSSPFAHPEYMEQAELRAEQIRNKKNDRPSDD